jgi:DMSO reductase family type II enzyme heme b subunit
MRTAGRILSIAFILYLPIVAEEAQPLTLHSRNVVEVPILDGSAQDKVWQTASSLVVPMEKLGEDLVRTSQLAVTSVHTATEVFFLVQWLDGTRDNSHKPWIWNKAKGKYEQGKEIEDMMSFGFPLKGKFTGNMTSYVETQWDVWYWKAARTAPAGYAMDKHHIHTFRKPRGKAKAIRTRTGKMLWIARPEDEGESPQKKQKAPPEFKGENVPQYIAGKPAGSAADVKAQGKWQNGLWTLELSRKLNTGHSDDAVFKAGDAIYMALAVFDHSEHEQHSVSKVIVLQFEK